MTERHQQLRDDVAKVLRVRRPVAWRVVRWVHERLHKQMNVAHGEAGVVPFRSKALDVTMLVATVDYSSLEVGCAICGEFMASQGEALLEGTRAVQLDPDELPRELRELGMRPAILYCAECWPRWSAYLREAFGLEEPA